MFIGLKNDELNKLIQNSDLPILIYFYGSWCEPCRTVGPAFETLAKELEGLYNFVKIVTDDAEEELMSEFNIRGVPTIVLFKDNKEVSRIEGSNTKEQIQEAMAKAFHGESKNYSDNND